MDLKGLEPEEFTTTQARIQRSYQLSQELAQTTHFNFRQFQLLRGKKNNGYDNHV